MKTTFSSKVSLRANKAYSTLKLNPNLTNVDAHGNISRYTISVIAWVPLKYTDLALKVSHMAVLKARTTHAYKYNPSTGPPSCLVFIMRSRADRKSSIWTLMRRSLKAIRPASVQMARISAPERSSFWLMNSSRSTSSPRDILEVCKVKIFFFVVSGRGNGLVI